MIVYLEIEDTKEEYKQNEEARVTLEDYHATYIGPLHFNTIKMPTFTNMVNLEMKPTLIHLLQNNQFHEHNHENP